MSTPPIGCKIKFQLSTSFVLAFWRFDKFGSIPVGTLLNRQSTPNQFACRVTRNRCCSLRSNFVRKNRFPATASSSQTRHHSLKTKNRFLRTKDWLVFLLFFNQIFLTRRWWGAGLDGVRTVGECASCVDWPAVTLPGSRTTSNPSTGLTHKGTRASSALPFARPGMP